MSPHALEGGADALRAALALGVDRYRIFAEVARRLEPDGAPIVVDAHGRALAAAYTRCCLRTIAAAAERRGGRGAMQALRALGLRVWVASATPARDLMPVLRGRGLVGLLHGALGGPASKRDGLLRIMRRERAAPSEVVLVGGSPDDQNAARQLGTWFVALTGENRLPGPAPLQYARPNHP